MSLAWRKILRDLTQDKLRTLLVVLSTAVGIFTLGLVIGMAGVMRHRMTEDHQASIPSHITFQLSPFEVENVEAIRQEPDVADARGEANFPFRWKQEGSAEWRDGNLIVRTDYEQQDIDRVDLLSGDWPGQHMLAVERQSSRYFAFSGDTVIVVESSQDEKRLPISGVVRSPTVFPPQFGGDATFYATPDTLSWLTGRNSFNQLHVRLSSFSEEKAREVANNLQTRLGQMGIFVAGYMITDPDVHWLQEQANTIFLILGVMGILSLGLSTFLITNTMNAIVAQQVRQIGVMKVIGATFGRIVRIYLVGALIYGLLALLVAIPLGVIAVNLLAGWLLNLLNIDIGTFQVAPAALGAQIAIGLMVPVLAALIPVVRGARISCQQAMNNYGLSSNFGQSKFDRLTSYIHFLPSTISLSLRNIFRRKVRATLTLFTLIFSGVMFIMVMSVNSSLNDTIDRLSQTFRQDVLVGVKGPQSADRLVEIAQNVPEVSQAEVWNYQEVQLTLAGGNNRQIGLWGLPPDSAMFSPKIVEGRWLQPAEAQAIVLNNKIAADEGIRVGDTIELVIDLQPSTWMVVGLAIDINNSQRNCFVPLEALNRESDVAGRENIVAVTSARHEAESQEALMNDLRAAYTTAGMELSAIESASEVRARNRSQFNIVIYLMLAMVVLTALVGSLGLAGTMSLNVVERTREIGVMRSVGATSFILITIFVGEGVLLAVLSWLLAVPLSVPGSYYFSNLVGERLEIPLEFQYSLGSLGQWLAIVVILATLAGLWPALRAVKVSVRESLAYE